MKIAMLSRNFSPSKGGAEKYAVELAKELSKHHDIHIYCQETNFPIPGITYHHVARIPYRLRWLNQLLFSLLTWLKTRNKFDIVHSHEHVWHGNVHTMHVRPVRAGIYKNYQGLKYVLRWLNVLTSPRHLTYLWLERMRIRNHPSHGLVFVTDSLYDEFASYYSNIASHCSVIPPGVDISKPLRSQEECRLQLDWHQGQTYLLFVANDFERKGLQNLLLALCKLKPSIMLAVIGQSNHYAAFESQVYKFNLTNRVHFYGQQEDISVFYSAADLLVHPTLEDSFGMVVLEAMLHKLPVLVSDSTFCGFVHQLRDGVHIKTIQDPRNPTQLSEDIDHLLQDFPLQKILIENSHHLTFSHSWETVALKYEGYYQQIIKNRCR